MARWWGPAGFANTFHKFEFRPGGEWHLTMHGPDGTDYENVSRFSEIQAPERIVFEHLRPGHWYRMSILLEPHAGGTRLTWHMAFESTEECAKVREFVIPANEQNFDRLAAVLTFPAPARKPQPMETSAKAKSDKLTLTRIFAAPRPLVFAAWTQPRHMKKWSAPRGFTLPVSRGSLRVGGKWRACMVSPDGEKLWLSGVYREVVKNKKVVFSHTWKAGDEETLVTVRLSDHPRGTKMIFTQSGFESAASRDGHKGGWSECFTRLAEHLAQLRAGRKHPAKKK